MKAAFAIWVREEDFREVAKALREICKGCVFPMVIEARWQRLTFAAGSAVFNIPCECGHEFSATAKVGAVRRLLKIPKPLPKLDGRIMLAVRPMDNKIATEWASAKVKFLSVA